MKEKNGQSKGQTLALAAALATLGLSVGVDVQGALAAEPEKAAGSTQIKVDGHKPIPKDTSQNKLNATQNKLGASQHKLPSVQDKATPVRPGVKPVDPVRR